MKIALCGSAPASSRIAPYQNPGWEIWGCSPGLYGIAPRVTAWFELHLWEPGQPWFSPEYVQWLAALPERGVKLWVGSAIPDLPGAQALPHQDLIARFDPDRWFFTSSLSWMMAQAIVEIDAAAKAEGRSINPADDKIGLWGVDMAATEEYQMQRSGIHFFAKIARSMGIEVGVPMESDLFTPRFLYGIDEWTHSYRKIRARKAELNSRLQQATNQRIEAERAEFFMKGALDDLEYCGDTWADKSVHTGPVATGPHGEEAAFHISIPPGASDFAVIGDPVLYMGGADPRTDTPDKPTRSRKK